MLSIESFSTDPRCPQQDLSTSAIVNETSFPKFSIREFVLSSRSKNIKEHWPFSSKSLQLCLKHGVKDILPPFQPLHSVTAPSIDACTIEKTKPESRSISSLERKPAQWDHHRVLNSSKLAKGRFSMDKKGRFSVKCRAQRYQASGEDIVSIFTATSEATMASKTCPVCKTFSSPSNTTLNAHMDRCLYVESTPTWSLDSRSMKHKFKPRKTKLLVDIYTTATPCTLEDLDRRNGTTWAIASRPAPDAEKSDTYRDGKRDRGSLASSKITNEDGVYFDIKGTKLRSLSAFNDESSTKGDNLRSTRPKKEGKKFKSLEREKYHASKHRKLRKLAVPRKQISPRKEPTSQIDNGHDGDKGLKECCEMDEHQMNSRKPQDSGCLRQWICSKRTGVAKKVTGKEDHPKFKRKWVVTEDLLLQSDQSRLDDTKNEKNSAQRLVNMSENPNFSPANINMSQKRSARTSSQTDFRAEKDGKITSLHSEKDRRCWLVDKNSESWSEREDITISQRNETMGSKSLLMSSQTHKHCDDDSLHSSVHGGLKCFNPNVNELFNSSIQRSGLLQLRAEEQDLETRLEFDDRPESTVGIRYNSHDETSPGNSFDPIPIPGPPGSFLPSPGTMQSDEFQGNSSLTSSQVLSDEQDFTDGDSSDSPFSSSSTFSAFTATRFDLDYLPAVDLNHQQPQLLKHLSFPAAENPCCNRQKGYNLNRRLVDFEISPLCCCHRSEKATVSAPIGQLSESVLSSIRNPEELGVKLPDCGNFESAASSSSHPVLRLMGKNLMVMNKNEDAFSRVEQTKPCSPIIPVSEFPTNLNTSHGNSANKEFHFFRHQAHVDENSWNYTGRRIDPRLLDGIRTPVDLKTSQTFLPRPEVMHRSNQGYNLGFIGSMEPPRYHRMNANSGSCPNEEIRTPVDAHLNRVKNMAAYGPKYSRDIRANRRLAPGF